MRQEKIFFLAMKLFYFELFIISLRYCMQVQMALGNRNKKGEKD